MQILKKTWTKILCVAICAVIAVSGITVMRSAASGVTYKKTTWTTFKTKSSTSKTTSSFYHSSTNTNGRAVIKIIDVSTYQGDINFSKVKKSGVKGVIIRCAHQNSDGSIYEDDKFDENIKAAKKAGLKVGAYIYSEAITVSEAKKCADFAYSVIKNYSTSLPVVFDYESSQGRLSSAGLSNAQRTQIAKAFLSRMENKYGREAMLYASSYFLAAKLNTSSIASNYGIWMARYNSYSYRAGVESSALYYSGRIEAWQATSCGYVPGISGRVDIGFYYDKASVKISGNHKLRLGNGEKLTANTNLKHFGSYSENYTWSSSDTSVATVSQNGYVTGKKVGTARITAVGKTTKSKKTFTVQVKKLKEPGTTKITKKKSTKASVTLYWKKAGGATRYAVYRSANTMSKSKKWKKVGETPKTSFTDKTVKSGTEYAYIVVPVNKQSWGSRNGKASGTVLATAKGNTFSVKAKKSGTESVKTPSGKEIKLKYKKGQTFTAIAKSGKYYKLKTGKYISKSAVLRK